TSPRTEISSRESLAHRALGAAGNLRLAALLVHPDGRTRKRHQHSRAGAISFARRIRALLHARRPARRIYSARTDDCRAHRSRDRVVAEIAAVTKKTPALRPRGQGRAQLRKLGIRSPRRRRPCVSQAAVCNGGLTHEAI